MDAADAHANDSGNCPCRGAEHDVCQWPGGRRQRR